MRKNHCFFFLFVVDLVRMRTLSTSFSVVVSKYWASGIDMVVYLFFEFRIMTEMSRFELFFLVPHSCSNNFLIKVTFSKISSFKRLSHPCFHNDLYEVLCFCYFFYVPCYCPSPGSYAPRRWQVHASMRARDGRLHGGLQRQPGKECLHDGL